MLPPHRLISGKPFRKTAEGHPVVDGDSTVQYAHGPKAAEGLQDSHNRPRPGHPAPQGGAPAQQTGKPFGGGRSSNTPTMQGGF